MQKAPAIIARLALHLAALAPLGLLLWRFAQHSLGANPIREVQLRTGDAAIDLLLASLACTPIQIVSGWQYVLKYRGLLGRYSLAYATLHFFNFLGIDYGFNLGLIRQDLFEKRYAIIGFAAFILLLAAAIFSSQQFRQTCGALARRLRWLVYPAACLAVLHYLWQAKIDTHWPVIYAAILLILLLARVPPIRRFFSSWLPRLLSGVHKPQG